MSVTNPLASFFGQAVSGTQQQPAQTNQANYMNQLGAGGGAYYPAALQQAMYNQASAFDNKKYKLIEEERDLLLNNPGLQELAANLAKAKEEYDTFLALLRK